MKKFLFGLIVFCFSFFNVFALDIYSKNAIVYNMNDDNVIFEKNSDEKVSIASLTKIMTAIVTLENVQDINEKVVMPKEAFNGLTGYAVSGIKAYDKVTYLDLLYGIMLPSGADCANALAILTSGSISNFVQKMNDKASELNLSSTHFSNPVGMDYDNYSSVSDVAKLLKYALKNEVFYKLFTARRYVTTNNIIFESTVVKKGKSVDISNILGGKTGYTDDAGNCLASISKINGVKYLSVTVGASTSGPYHIADAANIFKYFSSNFGYKRVLKFDQLIDTIKINNLFRDDYSIRSDSDLYLYLSNDVNVDSLNYEYEGKDSIDSKMKKGDLLGKVSVKNGEELLFSYDVFLDRDIPNYNYIIICSILIFIILFFMIRRKKHEV